MKTVVDSLNRYWYIYVLSVCSFYPTVCTFGCTIFILTDSRQTLFFNNEDYSNFATAIWFQPATKKQYGCAYLGFDDAWAQGGLNDHGLAFDWVAGSNGPYQPDTKLKPLQGNPAERMLESCKTVQEAIAFYHHYREVSFASGRMLIADKTGASVIIGARNGQLYFDLSHHSRGFGYGYDSLEKMLTPTLGPSLSNGLPILKACRQDGMYATKYSSVYNLNTGEIRLVALDGKSEDVSLNLASELKKRGHYYEIPAISQQLTQLPVALTAPMKRYLAEGYEPFPADEPATSKLIKRVISNAQAGSLRPADFTPEFWKMLAPVQNEMRPELAKLGKLMGVTLIERNQLSHLYLMDYQYATVLQRFDIDANNRISLIKSEGAEMKIGVVREK